MPDGAEEGVELLGVGAEDRAFRRRARGQIVREDVNRALRFLESIQRADLIVTTRNTTTPTPERTMTGPAFHTRT